MKKYLKPDIDILIFDEDEDILTNSALKPKTAITYNGEEKTAVSIGIEDFKIYDRNYDE